MIARADFILGCVALLAHSTSHVGANMHAYEVREEVRRAAKLWDMTRTEILDLELEEKASRERRSNSR